MQRKPVQRVVSIDSARSGQDSPTPDPSSPCALSKKRFVLNQHTRRTFLALVFGPMSMNFDRAIKEARHDKRDGWEQIVNLGRREWERRVKGIAA